MLTILLVSLSVYLPNAQFLLAINLMTKPYKCVKNIQLSVVNYTKKNSPHRRADDAKHTLPHVVSFRPLISDNANRTHINTTLANEPHPLGMVIDTKLPYYDDPSKCTWHEQNIFELVKNSKKIILQKKINCVLSALSCWHFLNFTFHFFAGNRLRFTK